MINQALLNYIKQELQKGINQEEIKSSLSALGWQSADIQHALDSIGRPNKSNSSHKIKILVIALVCAVVAIGGFIGYLLLASKFDIGRSTVLLNETPSQLAPNANEKTKTASPQLVATNVPQVDISKCNIVDSSLPLTYQKLQKNKCISEIAIKSEDISLCEKTLEGEDESNQCYTHFAIKEKDISICEKIYGPANPSGTGKGQCRYAAAVATQDVLVCNTLPDEHRGNFTKDACYAAIGGDKKDYNICYQIPEVTNIDNEDYKYQCIQDVASRKGECEMIPKPVDRDYCNLYQIEDVRVTARDNRCDIYKEPKLANLCTKHLRGEITLNDMCNKIIDSELKKECLTYDLSKTQHNYNTGETILSN